LKFLCEVSIWSIRNEPVSLVQHLEHMTIAQPFWERQKTWALIEKLRQLK